MTRESETRETKSDEEIRAELRELLVETEKLRARFAVLWESIPPSAAELEEEDIPPDLDFAAEVRLTIEALLHDRLDPMIEALTGLAGVRPQPAAGPYAGTVGTP